MGTLTPTVAVSISPRSASLLAGETATFSATVTGSSNKTVTWAVNGTAGGSSTFGTVSSAGLYTAPASPPSPNVVTVSATSATDSKASASAAVTISNPVPTLGSIFPTNLIAGGAGATITLSGGGFAAQSVALANGTALATRVISGTQLTAVIPSAMLATAGTLSITVVTAGPGGGTSTAETLMISIAVSISPATQIVNVNQPQQFTAKVTGAADQSVTWAVNGIAGGNGAIGTVTTAGLYTAPGIPPSPNSVSITATSSADPTQSAAATVTIVNPAPALYSISPDAATADDPDTTLTVGGAGFTAQSAVYFNSTALATVDGSASQLTATIPSSLLASTGTFSITVVNPGPGGGTSTSLSLTIWAGYPRAGAGSVLSGPPPALAQVPQNGTVVSVLD